ncbi:MAG: CBS domain protein [Fluviibacter phosphoraccumulans EoVTN8]
MLVQEILKLKGNVLYTTHSSASLAQAVEALTEHDAGSLVVMDGGEMTGLITFREVLQAVAKTKGDLSAMTVADFKVVQPIVVRPDMLIEAVRELLVNHHQRYVPVMDGKVLMGVVSFIDVAKAVLEEQGFKNRMLKNFIKNWPEEEGND